MGVLFGCLSSICVMPSIVRAQLRFFLNFMIHKILSQSKRRDRASERGGDNTVHRRYYLVFPMSDASETNYVTSMRAMLIEITSCDQWILSSKIGDDRIRVSACPERAYCRGIVLPPYVFPTSFDCLFSCFHY